MNPNDRFRGILYKNRGWVITAGIALALLVRVLLRDWVSTDYTIWLSSWFDYIVSHGRFMALKDSFSNYNPPYLYLLTLVSYLPLPKLYAIKLISIVFDFVLGYYIYRLVQLKYPAPGDWFKPVLALFAVLFAPTVIMNSSSWAQCDSIFTAFLAAGLYYFLKDRIASGFILFGAAFAFKLQAVFLFPFLLVVLFVKKASALQLGWLPLVYFLAILPSLLLGRPLWDLLTIYLSQTQFSNELSGGAANIYQFIPMDIQNLYNQPIMLAGLGISLLTVILILIAVYRNRGRINSDALLKIAFSFVLLLPYLLPRMRDRYFYLADVLSIVFAFYFPKYFYVPIVVITASLLSYVQVRILFGLTMAALPLGIVAGIAAADMMKALRGEESNVLRK